MSAYCCVDCGFATSDIDGVPGDHVARAHRHLVEADHDLAVGILDTLPPEWYTDVDSSGAVPGTEGAATDGTSREPDQNPSGLQYPRAPARLRDASDQALPGQGDEVAMEAVSVFVITASEPTARMVAPALAKVQYADCAFRFGKVLSVEWMAVPPEGFTLPGFEVAVEVDPLITPLSGAIRAEDRPRA